MVLMEPGFSGENSKGWVIRKGMVMNLPNGWFISLLSVTNYYHYVERQQIGATTDYYFTDYVQANTGFPVSVT